MKKGQVTIFIILGLLILLMIGVGTYIYGREARQPFENLPRLAGLEPEQVRQYVEGCLEKVAQEGIYLIAAQGGYINPKGDPDYGEEGDGQPVHYYTEHAILPYQVNKDTVQFRPLSQMMSALNKYIVVEFPKCLDFREAKEQGYTILTPDIDWTEIEFNFSNAKLNYSFEPVRVSSLPRIDTSDIAISVTYPIVFKSSDSTFSLTDFFAIVPLRIALIHKIANKAALQISSAQRTPKSYGFPYHCNELSSQDGLVNIYTTSNNFAQDYAIRVIDAKPVSIGKPPLRYQFAVRNVRMFGGCFG